MTELKPGARFTGLDLSPCDFTDADLTDAVFEACRLTDVQVQGAVMQGAQFKGCRLIRCRFSHADLREAAFEDCVFADDAGHAGVAFAFGRLETARFARCDLSFARFERLGLYGIEMEACNLRGAVFLKADFARTFGKSVVRSSAAFRGCNLELADLVEARLPDCDLRGSSFREAMLLDADLEGADLRDCDFFQAATTGAKLARADLRGAEVSGLDLMALGSRAGLMVAMDQQHPLLSAMGLDVHAE